MALTRTFVWILIGATVFSNFHLFMGADGMLRSLTTEMGPPPLYTPIAVSLGFDPIWFGILMILNMEIAIQTPPYGFALFYLKSVAPPEVTMLDIYRSIGPFVAIKFLVLVLCLFAPELVLWLPNRLFG